MNKRFLFLFLLISSSICAEKRVELVHNFTKDVNNQQIFDHPPFLPLKQGFSREGLGIITTDLSSYANVLKRPTSKGFWPRLKQKIERALHPHIALSGDIAAIVFWNYPPYAKDYDIDRIPKEKLILFMWEPPTVHPYIYRPEVQALFSKIYTWNDDLVDNVRFFKFDYPVLREMLPELVPFEEKKLCTLVIGKHSSKHPQELYSERERTIDFFEEKHSDDFEFYGHGWSASDHKSYRGSIPDKLQVIKHYRFSICYENMRDVRGYITEKIFDSFAAGCVPVYLGASNIAEVIPKGCFIDRRNFNDLEELYLFLNNMEKEEYESYLSQIHTYLNSPDAKRFSQENFVKIFLNSVVQSSEK